MAVKALQQWCKIQCGGYRDVSITNMTTSFRDGLAFCALIHKHRPDLIDFDSLSKENIYENNQLAFQVAERELGIPALLDAEDMVALKVPDRLSILTYVSQYYNYFHGRSPIGGLAGVKRPAEESNEEPSGKKNQPVTAKAFASPKPATENLMPKPASDIKRDVLVERANKTVTLSSNCNMCNQHVHLVQRHLVDGKLYHRNCFRCKECSTILLSGTYKAGKEPGTFICRTHTSIEKPPTTLTTHITVLPQKTQSSNISKSTNSTLNNQNASSAGTGKAGSTAKLGWLTSKSDRTPTRDPATTPSPAVQRTPAPKTTPTPVTTTIKTPNLITPSETSKNTSSGVQKNQEARKRFFESSNNSSSSVPVNRSTSADTSTISVTPGRLKTSTSERTTPGITAGTGASKGRVQLWVGDWTKVHEIEKEKENEKEKAKAVIGKMVIGDKNNSNLSPAGLKASGSNASSAESCVKGPLGRVRLKPLDVSMETTAPAAGTPSWIKDKSSSKPANSMSANSKENDTAPSDWRSMLKPVSKTVNSIESTGTPSKRTEAASLPRTSSLGISQASVPAPSTTNYSTGINHPKTPSPSPLKNGPRPSDPISSSSISPVCPSGTETHKLHKPDYIPKEEIMKELKEIEMNLNELEKRGVELEKQLRQCDEEGQEDTLMNDLMVDWFNLIRNKQVSMRRESELVYIARTQDLEEEQPSVEAELRRLLEKPEHLKTFWDRKREEELMAKLVDIVNDRNAILEGLDEDRLREEEEDEQLNKMIQSLDMKKDKIKKKSSISKWFSRKSKRTPLED
ncbi:MICAL-like protein 2 [Xyrauchen texanus]|uniref:MICAL-like protein 2 n=1 Tax=Xyrauchen texanus TaxID=154827 RepID=UPI002241E2BF|nr:MICAL-like protein 2 [Xyrauchen texanus]XP_051993147.1 MICAL-like protein 2 [Xyrauchen texanus]